MRIHWTKAIAAVLIALGAWNWWSGREVVHPPGVIAAQMPLQAAAGGKAKFVHDGFEITPLQSFEISARVLGATVYRFDREAKIAPVDLALGWGRMSDSEVLKNVRISQSGRFYFWQATGVSVPRREIETHSANMHMIPATRAIAAELKRVRTGQLVTLRGYLVEVRAADGWRWRSSLTREDTGAGACELIWVEALSVR